MSFTFTKTSTDKPAMTVAQVNRQARGTLEGLFADIWVEAEVTEVTKARSGHIYFKLSDPDGRAQIDAVMWRGQAMRYGNRILRGKKVKAGGRVTLYEAGGRYQFVTDRIDEAGAGDKAQMLAKLRARLEKEGLFDPDKKRRLPKVPRCVGVVTSKTGAAVQDILKVTNRRFPARLLLAHAQVQGDNAAREIVAGIKLLGEQSDVEVIIVGRGGGSSDDLDAFNAEAVVRAIAESPVPVISAVGHEVDITLADLAADKRAATPSEAAELAVPDLAVLTDRLTDAKQNLSAIMHRRLGIETTRQAVITARLQTHDPRVRLKAGLESLSRLRESMLRWPSTTLGNTGAQLDELTNRLHRWPNPTLSRAKGELALAVEKIYRWPDPTMATKRGELGRLAAGLDALSPLASLKRGYSIVHREYDKTLIKSHLDAPPGTQISIKLAQGELSASVTKTKE